MDVGHGVEADVDDGAVAASKFAYSTRLAYPRLSQHSHRGARCDVRERQLSRGNGVGSEAVVVQVVLIAERDDLATDSDGEQHRDSFRYS